MEINQVKSLCTCPACPSYKDCGKELGFCMTKKSKCIKQEQGCLCPACPVSEKLGLRNVYYCIRGNEKEQNKK